MAGVQRGLSRASTSQSWDIKCLHMGKCRPPPGMRHRSYANSLCTYQKELAVEHGRHTNSYGHTTMWWHWDVANTQTDLAALP